LPKGRATEPSTRFGQARNPATLEWMDNCRMSRRAAAARLLATTARGHLPAGARWAIRTSNVRHPARSTPESPGTVPATGHSMPITGAIRSRTCCARRTPKPSSMPAATIHAPPTLKGGGCSCRSVSGGRLETNRP